MTVLLIQRLYEDFACGLVKFLQDLEVLLLQKVDVGLVSREEVGSAEERIVPVQDANVSLLLFDLMIDLEVFYFYAIFN